MKKTKTLPTLAELRQREGYRNVVVLADQPAGLPRGVVRVDIYYADTPTTFTPALCRNR